mgnify:CR=1 FL=1
MRAALSAIGTVWRGLRARGLLSVGSVLLVVLAVASALHLTLAGEYAGVTVSRPVVPLGDTLGFLPGSLDEKLSPWLKPIFDALELILSQPPAPEQAGKRPQTPKPKGKAKGAPRAVESPTLARGPVPKPYQRFLDSGLVEIEALCYIRGRSIPKRFFIFRARLVRLFEQTTTLSRARWAHRSSSKRASPEMQERIRIPSWARSGLTPHRSPAMLYSPMRFTS